MIEKLYRENKELHKRKITLGRLYRGFLIRFLKSTFRLWERLGFHITPIYCYDPLPDMRKLKDFDWSRNSECFGIDFNETKQIELLEKFSSEFREEYNNLPLQSTGIAHEYYIRNGTFSSVDGEILYSFIRYFKPEKIIEIGSGQSTYLSARAILKNKSLYDNYDCELTTIDPYPPVVVEKGFPGLKKLIDKEVQKVPLSEFTTLKENDILFIDSSHVLKIDSDIQYEYLEILPRLAKGVIIHIHDIYLPGEYPRSLIYEKHEFWTEQYLVHAFLMFNKNFEILWAGNYMNLKYPGKLEDLFKTYIKGTSWPVSLWIKKII